MSDEMDREVSPSGQGEDARFDRALRPRTFDEYVGQEELISNLKVFVRAAAKRGLSWGIGG